MRALAVLGVFAALAAVAVAAPAKEPKKVIKPAVQARAKRIVKSGKTLVPATIDLVAINRGAVDAAVFFGSAGEAVPASFERQIVGKVAARIAS